jgi:hypothetical protein
MLRQQRDRTLVGNAGRDMGPLSRVQAFGEEAAKDIERRRSFTQDPVRMLVDQADRG